jgi:hypothetical protein
MIQAGWIARIGLVAATATILAASTVVATPTAAPLAPVQGPETGAVRREKAQGFEVQFVNTPWRPDVFEAMESGGTGGELPRSWGFAHLAAGSYFAVDEKIVPPGQYAVVLNPKMGALPMTLELRRAEGGSSFGDPNAMAPPPPGESVYKAPVVFSKTSDPVPALDVTLARYGDAAVLTVRYGNRKMVKALVRAAPSW